MHIYINKFGTVLVSRQAGREAYGAFAPTLSEIAEGEQVIVDFEGVKTFAPSWGDEFLTPIFARFGKRIRLAHTENPSVMLTLETLAGIHGAPGL